MKDTCKNCGAARGLHQYETGQCPLGGVERFPNVWTWTTYEEEDNIAARLEAAEKLAEAAKLAERELRLDVDVFGRNGGDVDDLQKALDALNAALAEWEQTK